MLTVTIRKDGKEFPLPPIAPGESGSLTDHGPPGTEILVFTCLADDTGATVQVSKAGLSAEIGPYHALHSVDLQLKERLASGGTATVPFTHRTGPAVLILRHRPGKAM